MIPCLAHSLKTQAASGLETVRQATVYPERAGHVSPSMVSGRPMGEISYQLLEKQGEQILCTRCWQRGIYRPVPQILARNKTPRTLCSPCAAGGGETGSVVPFRLRTRA